MLTKKLLNCLLVSLFLLGACHKDDNIPSLPNEPSCLLLEETCEDCSSTRYSYDSEGRLTGYVFDEGGENENRQVFEYDAYNRISKISTYYDEELADINTVYYADNTPYKPTDFNYKWTHYTLTSVDSPDVWLVKATYDDQGRRTKVESYQNDKLKTVDSFVYEGNNVKSANYSQDGENNRFVYEYYEDKKNKLRNVGELMTMADGGGEPYSQYLEKKVTSLDDPSNSHRKEYILNERGYPLKEKIYDLNGSLAYEYGYNYRCD